MVEGYSKTACGNDLSCLCVDYDYFVFVRQAVAPLCTLAEQNGEAHLSHISLLLLLSISMLACDTIDVECGAFDEYTTDILLWIVTLRIFVKECRTGVPAIQHNRGPETVAVTAFTMALATIAVLLRLVSHKYSQIKSGVSDYLIVVSLVS